MNARLKRLISRAEALGADPVRNNPYCGKTFEELIRMILTAGVEDDNALLEACQSRGRYEVLLQISQGESLTETEPDRIRPEGPEPETPEEVTERFLSSYNRLYGGDDEC